MMSKPIFKLRTVLSLATLSACVLSFAPATQAAGLLGGATGGAGGTLSPRNLDLNGHGRANVARDGNAQLPRGEKLRDAAGSKVGEVKGGVEDAKGSASEAKGSLAATKGAAIDKAQQGKDAVSGSASGSATSSGSVGVKREGGAVDASASGEVSAGR